MLVNVAIASDTTGSGVREISFSVDHQVEDLEPAAVLARVRTLCDVAEDWVAEGGSDNDGVGGSVWTVRFSLGNHHTLVPALDREDQEGGEADWIMGLRP